MINSQLGQVKVSSFKGGLSIDKLAQLWPSLKEGNIENKGIISWARPHYFLITPSSLPGHTLIISYSFSHHFLISGPPWVSILFCLPLYMPILEWAGGRAAKVKISRECLVE